MIKKLFFLSLFLCAPLLADDVALESVMRSLPKTKKTKGMSCGKKEKKDKGHHHGDNNCCHELKNKLCDLKTWLSEQLEPLNGLDENSEDVLKKVCELKKFLHCKFDDLDEDNEGISEKLCELKEFVKCKLEDLDDDTDHALDKLCALKEFLKCKLDDIEDNTDEALEKLCSLREFLTCRLNEIDGDTDQALEKLCDLKEFLRCKLHEIDGDTDETLEKLCSLKEFLRCKLHEIEELISSQTNLTISLLDTVIECCSGQGNNTNSQCDEINVKLDVIANLLQDCACSQIDTVESRLNSLSLSDALIQAQLAVVLACCQSNSQTDTILGSKLDEIIGLLPLG